MGNEEIREGKTRIKRKEKGRTRHCNVEKEQIMLKKGVPGSQKWMFNTLFIFLNINNVENLSLCGAWWLR